MIPESRTTTVPPAFFDARLALDTRLHGEASGPNCCGTHSAGPSPAADAAGARVVVVDAIDGAAASFSAHFGFWAATGQPLRLFQKISDIEAALSTS